MIYLKAGGKFIIYSKTSDVLSKLEFELKTNGFVNVSKNDNHITCLKPNYAIGSSAKLNFSKKAPAVWKLDDDDAGDTIDPDNLLDEDDLKKPDPSSLRGKMKYSR